MKFEIDPNELTTDQRAHVAAFITNWPVNAVRQERIDQLKALATSARMEQPTEEQRLDAEQKSDMDATGELREISGAEEAYDIGAAQAVNLKDIFGEPKSTAVPLDSQGLPWDSRIHSSSKATIADGSWKLRRGVDPAEVEKVKAQLKELMAVPQALVTDLHRGVATIPVPPAPVVFGVDFGAGPDITVVTPIPPSSVEIVPVPPAPKSHYLIDQDPTVAANQQPPTTVTLTDLIGRMSKAIAENRLTQAAVKEMCVKHGVSEFHLLGNRPDLLPLIDADMKAMGV